MSQNGFEPASRSAIEWLTQHRSLITDASDRLWLYAEPPLQEYRSASHLCALLEQHGFRVERGVAGLPTAFVASFGEGKPVIGTVAEYEAVENGSQMPVPYPHPVAPDVAGCYDMHHGLGAGAVGGALAVADAMRLHGIAGTIRVFGTPAEKNAFGKNIMGRAGVFEGLDACLSWHPSNETSVDRFISQQIRCNNQTAHTFTGVSAYNATPWGARNAFHAAELMDIAVHFIKDAILPVSALPTISAIHDRSYVNHAVSSVPGEARVIYVSRAMTRQQNEAIQARLFRCAEAAAAAIGVEVRNEVITGTWEPVPNLTLAALTHENIARIGPPAFSRTAIEYGQLIQKELGQPTTESPFGEMTITPPGQREPRNVMATTDTTTFCYMCPYAMVTTNYLGAWGWPAWATTSCGLTSIAHDSFMTAAKILATSILDLMRAPEALERAKREFEERTAGRRWYSPIPAESTPAIPPPLPDAHYLRIIEAFERGPKWQGWEPELSMRMKRICAAVRSDLSSD